MAKMGKDDPSRFISGALDGDIGGGASSTGYQNSETSNELKEIRCSRKGQSIKTAFALDNVGKVYGRYASAGKDLSGFGGGKTSLAHSLNGANTVGADDL